MGSILIGIIFAVIGASERYVGLIAFVAGILVFLAVILNKDNENERTMLNYKRKHVDKGRNETKASFGNDIYDIKK